MKERENKRLTLPLRVALVILILGALFKIMHWPYYRELMLIGGVLIGILYVIRFFYKRYKARLDYGKLATVLLWVFSYLVEAFHLFEIPYFVDIGLWLLILWWLIEEGFLFFKNRKFKRRGFSRIAYYVIAGLTTFALFFGIVFKIQHWPYGSLMLVMGILLLCVILIVDYFMME